MSKTREDIEMTGPADVDIVDDDKAAAVDGLKEAATSANDSLGQFGEYAETVKKFFDEAVPKDKVKRLPARIQTPMSVFLLLAAIALLIVFTILGFSEARSSKYLSFDKESGECEKVASLVDDVFLMNEGGTWETADSYNYPTTKFQVGFRNIKTTNANYQKSFAKKFEKDMQTLGTAALTRPLDMNLLYWLAWENQYKMAENAKGKRWEVQMLADPIFVFDRLYQDISLGNCSVGPSEVSFNNLNGVLTLGFSFEALSTTCHDVIVPEDFGYDADYQEDNFRFPLDIKSIISAVAVNENVVTKKTSQILYYDNNEDESTTVTRRRLQNDDGTEEDDGYYYADDYYDEDADLSGREKGYYLKRYAGSLPFYCSEDRCDPKKATNVANIRIGSKYAYPLFAHYGYSECDNDDNCGPRRCDCTTTYDYCNYFDFMLGFIYDPNTNATGYVGADFPALTSTQKWHMLRGAIDGNMTMVKDLLGDEYEMLVVNFYDQSNQNTNEYLYQLGKAHCTDVFTLSSSAKKSIEKTPPVSLVQDFFECIPTVEDALLTALGVAQGNSTLILTVFMAVVIAGIGMFGVKSNTFVNFSDEQKKELLDHLAYELMLLQKAKFRKQAGPNSTLVALSTELNERVEARGGEPIQLTTA